MSEANPGAESQSGGNKFSNFLKGLRPSSESKEAIEPEIPAENTDDKSLAYLTEQTKLLGIPNSFKPGLNVFPHDPDIDEERRNMSLDYPVKRSDGTIEEKGWETIIVDDHVEVWLPPQGDSDEPIGKRYRLDSWLQMQRTIIDEQKAEREADELQQQQLEVMSREVSNDRYAVRLSALDQDSEYKRLFEEFQISGDTTELRAYVHSFLGERYKKEIRYLPFISPDQISAKAVPVEGYPEVIDLDRIVGVDGWQDWRGRAGGAGGKTNQVGEFSGGTSGSHILHLAEGKQLGEFGIESDDVEVEAIHANDGTYYRIITGGHRIAADKLLGDKAFISADVTRVREYRGNFMEAVEAITKERIAARYVLETSQMLANRKNTKRN